LTGPHLDSDDSGVVCESKTIKYNQVHDGQIGDLLLEIPQNDGTDDGSWHFHVLALSRLRNGRLVMSLPQPTFPKIQEAWNLQLRTIDDTIQGIERVTKCG
jgi:hypothetical protein